MSQQPENTDTSAERRPWEPPRLIEFSINAHTKSRLVKDDASRPTEPPLPTGPSSKLGFSFEWALPLAYQATK